MVDIAHVISVYVKLSLVSFAFLEGNGRGGGGRNAKSGKFTCGRAMHW
jgi:hypothetical protein